MHKFLAIALVAAALAAGCATPGSDKRVSKAAVEALAALPCDAGHALPVTVRMTRSGMNIQLDLAPDPRPIGKHAAGVQWNIAGNQYAFVEKDGITFYDPPSGGSGPLQGARGSDETRYLWCFGPSTGEKKWAYQLKFYDKNDPVGAWICDPIIVNTDPGMFDGKSQPPPPPARCTFDPKG